MYALKAVFLLNQAKRLVTQVNYIFVIFVKINPGFIVQIWRLDLNDCCLNQINKLIEQIS